MYRESRPDQDGKPCGGSTRITNPKTIERWKANGKFDELISKGYIFAAGCGRFRLDPCTCWKCRRKEKK